MNVELTKKNIAAILNTKSENRFPLIDQKTHGWPPLGDNIGSLVDFTCQHAMSCAAVFSSLLNCRKMFFSKLLQNQNMNLWRDLLWILCRFSFLDNQKERPSSAWSSLSEGADLEMLLVFEGSDGIMKWLSHRWVSGKLQPLTVHPWNYEIPCQRQASIQGPTLSLGARRCIWKCAKMRCLDLSNSINPVNNRDCGWKTMVVIWGTLHREQSYHGSLKQTVPQSITEKEKSSRVRQNIANHLIKFEETPHPKRGQQTYKNPPISNIPSWIYLNFGWKSSSSNSHGTERSQAFLQ